ncbi:MAG TPA: hypothetical protein VG253_04185 [Streptosporangiaceae bacterium]|nr:hypothetical protein [Streptosporangiaceae bacterium]
MNLCDLKAMDRDHALHDLQFHWGDAYEITCGLGVWRAVRPDNLVSLVACDPAKLRELISLDYSHQPVPRGGVNP